MTTPFCTMILIAAASDRFCATCRDAVRAADRLIEVHDAASLRELLGKLSPSLLVLELGLSGFGDADRRWLMERSDSLRTVVVGQSAGATEVDWYLAGVRAVCPADIDAAQLQRVLAAVERGETWMRRVLVPQLIARLGRRPPSPGAAGTAGAAGILPGMTARETEVARLVAGGYSNKQIGRRLAITERTVKFHLSAAFRKLGVDDRLTLALRVASAIDPVPAPPLVTSGEAPQPSPDPVVPLRRRA